MTSLLKTYYYKSSVFCSTIIRKAFFCSILENIHKPTLRQQAETERHWTLVLTGVFPSDPPPLITQGIMQCTSFIECKSQQGWEIGNLYKKLYTFQCTETVAAYTELAHVWGRWCPSIKREGASTTIPENIYNW